VRHLPQADWVISVQDGKITEQGTFDELRKSSGYVSKLDLSAPLEEQTPQVAKTQSQPLD